MAIGARQAFVRTLVCAELNASNDQEFKFTNSIRERFERAGEPPKLSRHEKRALYRLATHD
ncbi:hypothetical protein DBR00_11605 [Pseudomonas sp. HMWF032]|uniref:hypothetical protein n=1 Tax=Pseudomonas sp. HMWF032 TaxID=2056866 RepID=UPI000D35E9D8|nr:hypothetical protein [Pseudomonas sp. HMWF032]PTS84018.1 hypothetical protein DBR00_11605 [Pseudomonas sp. HMWF032]PTT85373.1 hypothetical protein DBR41_04190 [Pseudomonas sp. HMWF010]